MKITRVKYRTEYLKLTRPYSIAYQTIDAVENIFVQLDTETGNQGLGVASPAESVTGESFDDCRAALEKNLEPLLLGRDIRHLNAISRELIENMPQTPAARTAIDIALHDVLAQHLDLPLVDLLGRTHQALPTSITIGIKSVPESLAEAAEYIERGFNVLKVKIGKSLEEDLEVLHKLRVKVGDDIVIRVDANQGYTAATFAEFMDKTQTINIEFVEQPLPADDIEGMFSLDESARRLTCADESLLNAQKALEFAHRPQPFGIYNIKLMKCGGIAPALQIADVAHLAGIDLMWGCMDESIVSIAAALHAALASPATKYLDLDGSLDLSHDLVRGGFIIKNGIMHLLDKPGLGIERID